MEQCVVLQKDFKECQVNTLDFVFLSLLIHMSYPQLSLSSLCLAFYPCQLESVYSFFLDRFIYSMPDTPIN